ncbi:MAG: flagellar brake protein [Saccharospirillum sp.]
MNTEVEGEIVNRRPDIVRMMRHAQSEMVPVTLVFLQSHQTVSTYILEVDAEQQRLLLDEPMPKSLARLLSTDEPFNLETRYHQVNVRARQLRARVTPGAEGDILYQCDLPQELYYLQRRKSFRAQARHSLVIDAHLSQDEAGWQGTLRDLSVTGCRLAFVDDQRASLEALEANPFELTLHFPNETALTLFARPARLSYDAKTQTTELGCQFERLQVPVEQQLAQVVTDLQRDQINFAKNGGKKEEIPERFLLPNGDLPPVRKPVAVSVPAPGARKSESRDAGTTLDLDAVWRNALAAVRKQEANARAEAGAELTEALARLADAWQQERQALMVFSRIRSPDNSLAEHRLATSLVFADHKVLTAAEPDALERYLVQGVLKRPETSDTALMKLIQAVDRFSYKAVEQWVYYRPTAAMGALHKQEAFEARLIRGLIRTQGLYPLGSCVRLSDQHVGMVLRHNDQHHPAWVRLLYKLGDETALPPKDVELSDRKVQVEGLADPVKLDLPVELLRPPLRA